MVKFTEVENRMVAAKSWEKVGVGESMVKGYKVSVMLDREVQGNLLYSIVSGVNSAELYTNCIKFAKRVDITLNVLITYKLIIMIIIITMGNFGRR